MSTELKQCPRCGEQLYLGFDGSQRCWWYCPNLDCRITDPLYDTEVVARDANRRTPGPATRAMLEWCKTAIAEFVDDSGCLDPAISRGDVETLEAFLEEWKQP